MATLIKLQISGIRSFGPHEDQAQQLKFGSPVTLILGQNGCGKTTIIECLKYVLSGEVPGGCLSGQGFVNDPKMSGAASTKGHIKLKFLDPRGNEITVSRVVEVVQTKTKLNFSSKNQTIRKITPNGDESSISGRCVDITNECCQLFNVSPAILNNVIFCHQENSLWPLDEGKKLKEKFDEIFDAQKYNKCTDSFRKHVKTRQDKMKLLNIELAHRKDKKEEADKKNRALQEKTEKLEKFEKYITTKTDQLGPITERMNNIFALEQDLAGLQKQLTTKETMKNGVIEEQNTIKKGLTFEFEGTDEELNSRIETFQNDTKKEQTLIKDLEKRKIDIESKSKDFVEEIEKAQTQIGKLKQQKNQHEQKCKVRTSLIQDAVKTIKIDLNSFEDHDGARRAIQDLNTELEDREMCLALLIDEKEVEQTNLQEAIDKLRENTATLKQNISSKRKETRECESKIEDISNELQTLSSSDSLLGDLKKRIETIDRSVYNLNTNFQEAEENKKIDTYKRDIQNLERNLDSLNSEYRILQENDVLEGKIESQKRLIMEKQKEINRIKSKHSENLKRLFDGAVPEKNLKEAVATQQRRADQLAKNLSDELTKKQKEVTTLEVQRNNQREKIATCEKELKSNQQKISQVCNGKNFNETLNSTFQKRERLQVDKGQYNSVKIIYEQFIKKFEEQAPCCPVCETDFNNKISVVQKIVSKLKTKINQVPSQLARVEKELEKEEALYSKLQQLILVNDDTESLVNNTLPDLQGGLETILEKLGHNMAALNTLKSKLTEQQKILEISNNLLSDVGSLDQNILDVERSEQTVDSLKQSLVEVASGKSKQEIEAEIDFGKLQVEELRNKVDTTTKNINSHKDRIQNLMQQRKDLVDKQVRLKDNIQSKPLLEEQKIELGNKIVTLNDEIDSLQVQVNSVEEKLQNAVANKNTITQRNRKQISEQREQILSYKKIVEAVQRNQEEIESYLNCNIEDQLAVIENKLKDYREKEAVLAQTKTQIIESISEKKENLAKQELRFKTLEGNVILRERKVLESNLESEIRNLKERIGGFNYRTVFEEKQRLEIERLNLERQINNLKGEKTGLLDNINELQAELNRPEFKKAYANYMAKVYEVKIAELTLKDLQIYVTALEKAVLEFHKAKMDQINRTIRSLWRNTYRGNDIDYIEIKAEHTGSGYSNRRSYNYKVVQVKKGVELDMRGRCSAGQKVLASLMIRLALAETLSSNCGILALDEPTTNLDRANILSMSDTLARIINARCSEKSFQLLIITHDEEFLNVLSRVQGVHSYYKVDRDKDGFSTITANATN